MNLFNLFGKKEQSLEDTAKKLAELDPEEREAKLADVTENKEELLDALADIMDEDNGEEGDGDNDQEPEVEREPYNKDSKKIIEVIRKGFTVAELNDICLGIEGIKPKEVKKMKEAALIVLLITSRSADEVDGLIATKDQVKDRKKLTKEEAEAKKIAYEEKAEQEEKAKELLKLRSEQEEEYKQCKKHCLELEEKGKLKNVVNEWRAYAEYAEGTQWAELAEARANVVQGVIDATTTNKTAGRKVTPIGKEELKEDMQNLIIKLTQYTLQLRDDRKSGIATFNRAKRDLTKIVRITFR